MAKYPVYYFSKQSSNIPLILPKPEILSAGKWAAFFIRVKIKWNENNKEKKKEKQKERKKNNLKNYHVSK